MADNNRKRSRRSDKDWSGDRNQKEYNQGNYGNINYGRDYERDMDWVSQSLRNRGNYSNAGYGGNYNDGGYGGSREQGFNEGYSGMQKQGYGNYGNAYSSNYEGNDNRFDEDRRRENRDDYGNDYGNGREYGRRYGTSGEYGSNYVRSNYGQGNTGTGGYIGRDYGHENYGNVSGDRTRNMYGGDTSNYGNANQGGFDRDWWDRTRDEVSSWFGDSDAERRRRIDKVNGPHRGKGPKGYHRSDERIKEDVSDRLCDNPMIDASDIEVKVEGSEVILTGTVESREDKRRAEDLAESVTGVSNVQNQLRVSHSDRPNNRSWNNEGRSE
jgi:osmotically-inducible protein OsmY